MKIHLRTTAARQLSDLAPRRVGWRARRTRGVGGGFGRTARRPAVYGPHPVHTGDGEAGVLNRTPPPPPGCCSRSGGMGPGAVRGSYSATSGARNIIIIVIIINSSGRAFVS